MTTVMASFMAIVLFGMIMIATISYGDSMGMMSAPDSVVLSQRLQSAAEFASQIQDSTGSRPRSAQEMFEAGFPASTVGGGGDLEVVCTGQSCSPMAICLSLPSTAENRAVVQVAATRVRGVMSGACGDDGAPVGSHAVVTLRI